MSDTRIIYEAYTLYYNKGMDALESNNYTVAKNNFCAAADSLLKLAKMSSGELKQKRLKRAKELHELAKKIEQRSYKETNISNSASNDLAKLGIDYKGSTDTTKHEQFKYKKADKSEFEDNFAPCEDTGVSLDDVAGLDNVKEEIKRLVIEPQLHPEIYKRFKREGGGGIMLYGVPGTGKTMIAQAIAHELDAAFFPIKCSDISSKFFGDSEQKIKALFDKARQYPTSIIFFDEFEAIGTKRSETNSSVMKRIVPELLTQIQGFDKNKNNMLVIAATNCPWDIDSAFMRSGRFSKRIYIPLPDANARLAMIKMGLNDVPSEADLDYNRAVELTKGFSGADIKEYCNKIKDYAIDRTLKNKAESKISMNDFEYAGKAVSSSVQEKDLKKMADYQVQMNVNK